MRLGPFTFVLRPACWQLSCRIGTQSECSALHFRNPSPNFPRPRLQLAHCQVFLVVIDNPWLPFPHLPFNFPSSFQRFFRATLAPIVFHFEFPSLSIELGPFYTPAGVSTCWTVRLHQPWLYSQSSVEFAATIGSLGLKLCLCEF